MKWLTIHTWAYQIQQKSCWHFWFAWYPVTIKFRPDGARDKVWLEWVERKGTYEPYFGDWSYEYRLPTVKRPS